MSAEKNNIAKQVDVSNNVTVEMKLSSSDGGDGGEYSGVGLAEISKIFETANDFFLLEGIIRWSL